MTYKNRCERCERPLSGGDLAYVCSYDCTWCPACASGFGMKCPNGSGELTLRPRRNRQRAPAPTTAGGERHPRLIIGPPSRPELEETRGCA